MSQRLFEPEEFVQTLKRSRLPTIVVEGKDDAAIYRWLENRIGILNASILPCGGRSTLLSVYRRRGEFSHLRTSFLADQDMWLFTAVPAEFRDIIWTTGYSIENDLYAGSGIESLLEEDEVRRHAQIINTITNWFAFEVEQYRAGRSSSPVNVALEQIMSLRTYDLHPEFVRRRGYSEPSEETKKEIRDEYKLKLRGKLLFNILQGILSRGGRGTRYNEKALMEICLKLTNQHPYLERLVSEIKNSLQIA